MKMILRHRYRQLTSDLEKLHLNEVVKLAGGFVIVLGALIIGCAKEPGKEGPIATAAAETQRAGSEPSSAQSLELSPIVLAKAKIAPAGEKVFDIQREAVGSIDFNEELAVQVFPPVQGKIISLFATAGDDTKAGIPLYTIDSPDLVQAGSNLISAAGVLELTTNVLKRAKELAAVQGIAQKDLEQAISDQQAAEGALKAARDAVRIFGKTDAEMDTMIAQRKVDPVLVVRSPITGRVTARNAAPGLLIQPGNLPAPYTLADISNMWMLANVGETDFPFLKLGEEIEISVKAYPGRKFAAKIVNIAASVDPNTHRVVVRSEVPDPKHELRPGMFATFLIRTGKSMRSTAVPVSGMVREGDGTMSVWVTTDGKRVFKRTVKVGLQQEGFDQILEGLSPGEKVATDEALFLSNALSEGTR